jgi:hypothetical protein
LIRGRCLPASLFERELNCYSFSILRNDVGAGLHTCVLKEGRRLVHFGIPETVRVMKCPTGVHARLGSRLGTSIDGWAKWMLARGSHRSTRISLAIDTILVGSS